MDSSIYSAQHYLSKGQATIQPELAAYVLGGAGGNESLNANLCAWQNWALCPKQVSDCRSVSTQADLLGSSWSSPIAVAPMARQKAVHPSGELAMAQAARAAGVGFACAMGSSTPWREVASMAGTAWFQITLQVDRADTLKAVRLAEDAGFEVLMVTVDSGVQQAAWQALALGFQWPKGCDAAHDALQDEPLPRVQLADLIWLRSVTPLPIVVKGILHPEDAVAVKGLGFDGVVVSNHGGRTWDGVLASGVALPEVRAAVGSAFPVLVDGGIRSGADVFKALALGANAVWVGRLPLMALAAGGALSAAHCLKLLTQELSYTMQVCGCEDVSKINSNLLRRAFLC